jgi:hypothetical protein
MNRIKIGKAKVFNSFVLAGLLMGVAGSAMAQEEKWDIFADYSYFRFNPTITGVNTRSFNGGGGGFQWNIVKWLGIKGDFQGYGSTSWTKTVSAPIVTPHGTIPAGSFTSQGNMFTYLFGPVLRVPAKKFVVYGEVLFGGSNTNGYGSLERAIDNAGGTLQVSGSQHPYTMAVGGGFDFVVSKVVTLRLVEADWMLTRYTNPISNTNNQNSFRYLGGVVFTFGGAQ